MGDETNPDSIPRIVHFPIPKQKDRKALAKHLDALYEFYAYGLSLTANQGEPASKLIAEAYARTKSADGDNPLDHGYFDDAAKLFADAKAFMEKNHADASSKNKDDRNLYAAIQKAEEHAQKAAKIMKAQEGYLIKKAVEQYNHIELSNEQIAPLVKAYADTNGHLSVLKEGLKQFVAQTEQKKEDPTAKTKITHATSILKSLASIERQLAEGDILGAQKELVELGSTLDKGKGTFAPIIPPEDTTERVNALYRAEKALEGEATIIRDAKNANQPLEPLGPQAPLQPGGGAPPTPVIIAMEGHGLPPEAAKKPDLPPLGRRV